MPAADAAADYAQLLNSAVAAYDAGDLTTARALFERVHAEQPTARTLRSLGLVAYREDRLEDAVAMLEASLASQVKPLTDPQRVGVQTVLNEARSRLGIAADDRVVPVPRSEPAASALPPPAVALPAPKDAAPPPIATRPDARRWASYGLFAGAVAAAVVSAVSYGTAIARVRAIESQCRRMADMRCYESDLARREKRADLGMLSALGLGAAIVAGVTLSAGTVVLLVRPSEAHTQAQLSFQRAF